MESWVIGYEGDADVERHLVVEEAGESSPVPRTGEGPGVRATRIRIRVVSDYI